MKQGIFVWVLLISIITFTVYGMDKQWAKKNKWRVKESTLLLLSYIGGGCGAWIGMNVFHHKTQKKKFQILVPLSCMFWIVILIVILLR